MSRQTDSWATPIEDSKDRRVRSPLSIAARNFSQHRLAIVGLVILTLLVLLAIAAPLIAPYSLNVSQSLICSCTCSIVNSTVGKIVFNSS